MKKINIVALCSILALSAVAVPSFVYGTAKVVANNAATAGYIVNNGVSNYSIKYFTTSTDEKLLGRDIQQFVKESTGATMPISAYGSSDKVSGVDFICLYKSTPSKPTASDVSDLTKIGSYKIKQSGDNIIICANNLVGLANGVYSFLEDIIGLQIFSNSAHSLDTLTSVSLDKVEFGSFNPDFDASVAMSGRAAKFNSARIELGQTSFTKVMSGPSIGAPVFHNFSSIISKAEFQASHPNWFSGTQLNLSYNNFEMVPTIVEKVKAKLINDNFAYKYITFIQEDDNTWSTSETSTALYNQYGTYSAEYIMCGNKIVTALDNWLQTNYPDKQITFLINIYHATFDAPSKYNSSTGAYEPIDSNVVFYNGSNCSLGAVYAPIRSNIYLPLEGQSPLLTNGNPEPYSGDNLKSWAALTSNFCYWIYSTYFDNYFFPHAALTNMKTNYQYLNRYGQGFILNQGTHDDSYQTNFVDLYNYIASRLSIDVDFDVDNGINDFCNAYYGPGGQHMKQYVYATENHYAWINNNFSEYARLVGCATTHYSSNLKQTKYFPKENIISYLELTNDAYSDIQNALDKGEITESEYQIYHDRIERDQLSWRYALRTLYYNNSAPTDWDESMDSFYRDAIRLGITRDREGHDM